MKYKIAIVDDKRQLVKSLSEKISISGDTEVVFTAGNGKEFLDKLQHLPAEQHPHVVLMDIDMPVMNGIEAVRTATSLFSYIKFIMLTIFDDDDKLFEAIKAGASGYLLKEESVHTIISSVKEIIEGEGAPMSPAIARKTLQLLSQAQITSPDPGNTVYENALSEREMEILRNQVSGMDYRQIGEKLFLSPNTVKKHISNIYKKLHITSKTEAVKFAIKNKWI